MTAGGGVIAPDGSPVEFYRHLPANGEPELLDAVIAPGASVLDLGCGAGRLARGLARLGHPVVAVDIEPAMLAALEGESGVEVRVGDLATIRLKRSFDLVVLASHLVNDPTSLGRDALLTAAAHVALEGRVAIETYPAAMDWLASIGQRAAIGLLGVTVTHAVVRGQRVRATVRYDHGDQSWQQTFEAVLLDRAALEDRLASAGLRFDRWLDESRSWLLATR